MSHEHAWSRTGLWVSPRVMAIPCVQPSCPAAMLQTVEIDPQRFPLSVCGVPLDLRDVDGPGAIVKIACYEATHDYQLDTIPLAPGALVLDIGAHVGTVSCYFAKTRPDVRVVAVEPDDGNADRLWSNLHSNAPGHEVLAFRVAVTGDGRDVTVAGDRETNSGGLNVYGDGGSTVGSVTLAQLLDEHGPRAGLLKIDCEGAEHEVLTGDVLARVDFLVGEFHHAPHRGHDAHALLARVHAALGRDRVRVTVVHV